MYIRVASANVQNTPDISRTKVRRCGTIVSLTKPDVAGFQEIRENGEDFDDIKTGMGHTFKWRTRNQSTPLAIGPRFSVLRSDWIKFHSGDRNIPTPERGASVVEVRRSLRPWSPRVAIFNVHFINGAFNAAHIHTQALRAQLWYESKNTLMQHLSWWYNEANCNVIVLGDWNRVHFTVGVDTGESFKWVSGRNSIDKVGVLAQPGWGFTVEDVMRVNTPSDHNATVVDLRLSRG